MYPYYTYTISLFQISLLPRSWKRTQKIKTWSWTRRLQSCHCRGSQKITCWGFNCRRKKCQGRSSQKVQSLSWLCCWTCCPQEIKTRRIREDHRAIARISIETIKSPSTNGFRISWQNCCRKKSKNWGRNRSWKTCKRRGWQTSWKCCSISFGKSSKTCRREKKQTGSRNWSWKNSERRSR